MIIGILSVSIHIPGSQSLKDKRQVIKSVMERTRNKFNVAIAEIGDNNLWQKAVLGIVCIGNEKKFINQVIDSVLNFIRSFPSLSLIDFQIELL
ncbi:MAG: DUF503 domain-containing protein [Nitrospirae bacterium]|nr:DUF503 domain-containing protein [Nitrospirota bacterium]MBI3352920.1 DUF503 domain-containing protein [Nitrospirota bacterium]